MILFSLILFIFTTLTLGTSTYPPPRSFCTPTSPCWPSPSSWSALNTTLSSRLIRTYPTASICHPPLYSPALCTLARTSWTSSPWRTSQPSAYSALLWELGPSQCFIDDPPTSPPCGQGLVPTYTVNVTEISDITKAVKWAREKRIRIVVKNTGHDHLGRSSDHGGGSLGIWTHNLKGMEFFDSFIPIGAGKEETGVPAIKLAAGEQWIDVYRTAASRGRIVVGGSARTVGAAGGYLTGGGHSPFSHFYGLAADNLLEATVITPNGQNLTLNRFTHPSHFWAIRGGGGNAWGIITSVTYRTHPLPRHIRVVLMQFNTTTSKAYRKVFGTVLKALPEITKAGWTGYASAKAGFQGIFLRANGTVEDEGAFEEVRGLIERKGEGWEGVMGGWEVASWSDYVEMFVQDPNIATNVVDTSRLLTEDVLKDDKNVEEIMDLSEAEGYGGFNFIGKVDNSRRDETAVHPSWKNSVGVFSLSTNWEDRATETEKKKKKQNMIEVSKRLANIVGKDGGTYLNEANPYEPIWKEAFWGMEKYEKLLKIKKKVDPEGLFMCNRCVGTDIVLSP